MNSIDNIFSRRSIRKFKDIPVEMEKLGLILEAGRKSPSAGNLQDWKFILVKKSETIQEIAKACLEQYWIATASAVIIICTDPTKTESHYGDKGKMFTYHNGAAATMSMLLAINDLGLASCWVGAFEDTMLKRLLNIPNGIIVHSVLPIGYPAEKPSEPARFTLHDIAFLESFGNKIKDIPAYHQWYAEHVRGAVKKSKELVKKFSERVSK